MAKRVRRNTMPPMERFWLCMMFLFAISIFNKGGYVLMAMIVAAGLLYFHSLRVDFTMLCLILFSLSYSIISTMYFGFEFTDFCNYLIGSWGAYLVGKCYTRRFFGGQPLFRLMLVLGLGFFAHGTLNLFMQLFVVYNPNATFRMTFDIWHNRYIAVTGAGMLYTLMTGIAFGILFSETKLIYKILSVGIIAVSLVYSFVLAHRTTIVMVLLIVTLYVAKRLAKGFKPTKKNVLIILLGFFLLIFLIVCLWLDLFGLRSWLVGTSLYGRMRGARVNSLGGRSLIWKSFLKQFWRYPTGGAQIPLYLHESYVHNMWLDVYYKCGVVPFLALTIATAAILLRMGRLLRSRSGQISPLTRNCLLFVTAAFLLNAFVEPVLDANPYFLFGYLMIAGGTAGIPVNSNVEGTAG